MANKNDQIKEGQDAKTILENPVMITAFTGIVNEGYQKWITTKAEDKEERESLYHSQIAALKVKQVLVNTIENGKLLEEERKGDING